MGLGTLLLVLLSTTFIDAPAEVWAMLAGLVAVPAVVLAFTETFAPLGPLTGRFLSRGPAGVLAAAFLHPGWPSGVLFSLAVAACVGAIVHFGSSGAADPELWVLLLGSAGSLILPALLIAPFDRRLRQRFTLYTLVFITLFVITLVFSILASAVGEPKCDFLWWLAWLPAISLPMLDFPRVFQESDILRVFGWWIGGFTGVLTVLALVRLRELARAGNPELDSP